MILASDFVDAACNANYKFYAGVPCSFLTPFINYVIANKNTTYVSAANEGDAVAMAAGASLGGVRSIAMMQNSGLGNAISPLTSLTHTFNLPILLICTLRGEPGLNDEPQHELMGEITCELLEKIKILIFYYFWYFKRSYTSFQWKFLYSGNGIFFYVFSLHIGI